MKIALIAGLMLIGSAALASLPLAQDGSLPNLQPIGHFIELADAFDQQNQVLVAESSAPIAATTTPGEKSSFGRIHLTVGPEFSYYPGGLNKDRDWLDDSTGFGMKQNIGASLRFDYQFLSWIGVSATAGYFGWELVRKYTRDGVSEYNETKRLTQIPLQLGIKIYPVGSFYIMPEGGVNLLSGSVKTTDTHPTPADESVSATPVTYGASLGYEIRSNALLIDLSIRYQILNVSNFNYSAFGQRLNESVNVAGFRIGIGLNTLKK
ncbi:hypothetical protein BN8_01950 [Fibrisoma limi BUZ 3]|uniref:Outer membrane protein beta-barrel domain-containing protein n=1 Tax=Fibrisoma limi BUZ 3 TaxID=1185876 RepID=I2GG84_9BACT|nr:outer membrane beta-barrel protein [Fibrisoma limi]CCH52909.1 hypothetical protein BN8_01950 [Fibrisoma limi BUZ 3]